MKKIKVIVFLVFAIFFTSTVYAGTAYVDKIVINAQVNFDGSMTVKETIVWDIEDSLNGLYRDILISGASNKLNSASAMEVSEVIVNNQKYTYSANALQNGASGMYNINRINGGKQIKIFTPSSDETKTTVITYTLKDVIVKYNDIAELYWNFIGSGWDYGIDDVYIKITLPGNSNNLKVFAHGPLYGHSEISSPNSVILQVDSLRSGEQVDARVLFDTALVNASKVVNENKLEDILLLEAKLAEQANIKRETAKRAFIGSIIVVVIALAIPIILCALAYKKALKPTFDGKYYRELPEDYGPAIMNKVIHPNNDSTSSRDMLATLLDLVRRKYVEIKPITKANKKKPSDYLLRLVKTDMSELNESEKHFVKKLIFVGTDEISLKELRKNNSKSSAAKEAAYNAYTQWNKLISEIAIEKELLQPEPEMADVTKEVLGSFISFLLLALVAGFSTKSGYSDIIGVASIVLGMIELIIVMRYLYDLNARTPKGVEHKAMWKAFKNFLLDFSKLDEHDYKSIAIWEHYLVYATALGVSKQVIKELKIVFPTEFEDSNNMFNTYVTICLLSDNNTFSTFSNSFNSATTTAFSSPSSSNGSGGGFSGGAGGGRWWRRRWRLLAK